jgi:hypothetical protein
VRAYATQIAKHKAVWNELPDWAHPFLAVELFALECAQILSDIANLPFDTHVRAITIGQILWNIPDQDVVITQHLQRCMPWGSSARVQHV